MTENSEIKPLTPEEADKKIGEVFGKLGIKSDIKSDEKSAEKSTDIAALNENVASSARDACLVVSWLFLIAAVAFSIYGVYTLYNNDYSARIVGGDAYNFIIYATRGTAWVCVGIVSAIIGLAFAVFANISNNSK